MNPPRSQDSEFNHELDAIIPANELPPAEIGSFFFFFPFGVLFFFFLGHY